MKTESEIIGAATRRLLQSRPFEKVTRKMLIQEISREFSEIYETGDSVEDSLIYESALWLLINPFDSPFTPAKKSN